MCWFLQDFKEGPQAGLFQVRATLARIARGCICQCKVDFLEDHAFFARTDRPDSAKERTYEINSLGSGFFK